MASVKENYWLDFHHNITNYNDWNDRPLSNMDIIEAINQVMLEARVITETNKVPIDMFMVSPQRNKIEDLINKVANLTINVGNENNMIDKVANLSINVGNKNNLVDKVANLIINVGNKNDLIKKLANMTINEFRNDSN